MVSPAQAAAGEGRSRQFLRLILHGQLRRHAKTAVPAVPDPVDQALVIEMDGHYVLSLMKERRNVQCIVIIMFRV